MLWEKHKMYFGYQFPYTLEYGLLLGFYHQIVNSSPLQVQRICNPIHAVCVDLISIICLVLHFCNNFILYTHHQVRCDCSARGIILGARTLNSFSTQLQLQEVTHPSSLTSEKGSKIGDRSSLESIDMDYGS